MHKKRISAMASTTIICGLTCLSFLFAFTGSAAAAPSEQEGKASLEKLVQTESKGRIKLAKFKKTNGITKREQYDMEFAATLEYVEDCYASGFYTNTATEAKSFQREINRRKGQKEEISGRLSFENTEQGWRVKRDWSKFDFPN